MKKISKICRPIAMILSLVNLGLCLWCHDWLLATANATIVLALL